MKKVYAFLMMAAALVACTREEQPRTETPNQPESPATYTLTIQASKGQDTRALALDGNTLNATWGGSEQVLVYLNGNPDQVIATLTPDPNGQTGSASCLLMGDFSQLPEAGNVLTLKLNSNNYSDQRGTLAYIADNCDYAVAPLHVTGVDNGQILSSEGGAEFESQQAIVKFSLKNDAGTAINPTSLTVQVGGTPVATVNQIDANSGGVLFVAIPAISGTIDLAATVGSDTYKYSRENVTFTAGKYYSITVKMNQASARVIDLDDPANYDADGVFLAQDGDVLSGTFPSDNKKHVLIADGASVTLSGATIVNSSTHFPGIGLKGNATIILDGKNTVGANNIQAGIAVGGPGTTLTIKGEGTLEVTGDFMGAGIGSRGSSSSADVISCGNIVILGGTIKATSNRAAGIGCGSAVNGGTVSCGNITISAPAKVTATKGWDAPYSIGPSISGQCGTVTIYGTTYVPEPGGILSYDSLKIPDNLPNN